MYRPINSNVEALAFLLAQKFHSPFSDGLVMRLGEGWEGNNIEALSSWCYAREEAAGEQLTSDGGCLDFNGNENTEHLIEQATDQLGLLLFDQSEQVWNRHRCSYPSPQPFMHAQALTSQERIKMAHALLEIFTGRLPLRALQHLCLMKLSGSETCASQRLAQWIGEQAPQYIYHPSELTLPLAHELVPILFKDMDG